MNIMNYVLPAAACLVLASCEKVVDFEYHDIQAIQVNEGLLTQEGITVRLTETVATDEPFSDRTVTDARVIVTDLTDNMSYQLYPDTDGVFTLQGLKGTTGHTYGLSVTTGENVYTSQSTMAPPTEIVSAEFNWIKMPYDDVAVLKVMFRQTADPEARYWLRVYRNGEPYEWQGIDSRNAVGGLVTGMLMTSRKDTDAEDDSEVLLKGDKVGVEVLPISRVMYDYLGSLNNGDYNGNRMFAGAYCLGYFLAAPVAKTEIIYDPDRIPYAE